MGIPKSEIQQDFDQADWRAENHAPAPKTVRNQSAPYALGLIANFFSEVMAQDYNITSGYAVCVGYQDIPGVGNTAAIEFRLNATDPQQVAALEYFTSDIFSVLGELDAEHTHMAQPAEAGQVQNADNDAIARTEDYLEERRAIHGRPYLGWANLTQNGQLLVRDLSDFVTILRKMNDRKMFWSIPQPQHEGGIIFSTGSREVYDGLLEQTPELMHNMRSTGPYFSKDAMRADFIRASEEFHETGLNHIHTLDILEQAVNAHEYKTGMTLNDNKPRFWVQ